MPALVRRDRLVTAVAVMMDVAMHSAGWELTGAAEVAQRLDMPRRGLEPVLQALTRSRLLVSSRGPNGGYRLSRAAPQILLIEIAAAVIERASLPGPSACPLIEQVIDPLWRQLNGQLHAELANLSLQSLLDQISTQPLAASGE